MDPALWRRVRDVVDAVLNESTADRDALLAARCGGDEVLRRECASLLAFEVAAERIAAVGAAPRDGAGSPHVAQRAGAWRVGRELGRGGMGTVHFAERDGDGFTQRGAIKTLFGLAGAGARERFRREQRALARLDHPGIARLIDSGETEQGLPFLVMEFVDGVPIDRWCGDRALPLRARLELFAAVCDAVHHAHQNLIVHRDLKPANILVDGAGRARIVDFGIARDLSPTPDEATRELPQAFTLRYASPEQVHGEDVSTVSDVYALGVVLYELLVGESPYGPRAAQPASLSTAIGEGAVGWPSARAASRGASAEFVRGLRGDLDAVLLRALARDPKRRCASAQELGADLRRHLRGDAVTARPDTLAYRWLVLWRRHRFAAVAAVGLLAGTLVASWSAVLAVRARAREAEQRGIAQRRYRDLRQVARSLVFDAHDSIRALPGATAARERLLQSAGTLLEALADHGNDDPALTRDLAESYLRLGDLQGRISDQNLGRVGRAEASYRRAEALALAALPEASYLLASARAKLAELLAFEGRLDEASRVATSALELRRELLLRQPERFAEPPDLAYLHERLFEIEFAGGRLDAAEAQLAESEAQLAAAIARDPAEPQWQKNLATKHGHRARLAEQRRDRAAELAWRQRAAQVLEELNGQAPARSVEPSLARAYGDLGVALLRNGDAAAGRVRLQAAVDLGERLVAADPADATLRADLSVAQLRLAEHLAAESTEVAIGLAQRALALRGALAAEDPSSDRAKRSQAMAADALGGLLRRAGRVAAARTHHEAAQAVFAELAARPGAGVEARRSLAVSHYQLGLLLRTMAATAAGTDAQAWRDAQVQLETSLGLVRELERDGVLAPKDAGVIALLQRELDACAAALAGR